LHGAQEIGLHLGPSGLEEGSPGDDHDIGGSVHFKSVQAKGFPKKPAGPVPLNRPAHAAAGDHSEPDARRRCGECPKD
jgi:hypothetical protein